LVSLIVFDWYPVPKEEAQEDGAAEDIFFHVYEYKVSLHKDSKEHRQLELVQKHTTIGKLLCLYYWMIPVGSMVVDGLYFNRAQQAPLWYTPSGDTTVVEVKYVLWTGLQLQPISTTNALPNACARVKAMRKKVIKVSTLDHEVIMEEATKRDRLEYEEDDVLKRDEDSEESKESDSKSK
jgi:hypothetical protein